MHLIFSACLRLVVAVSSHKCKENRVFKICASLEQAKICRLVSEGSWPEMENGGEKIQIIAANLESGTKEYCALFEKKMAALDRALEENEELKKRNKELEELLKVIMPDKVCTGFTAEEEECNEVGKPKESADVPSQLRKKRKYDLSR